MNEISLKEYVDEKFKDIEKATEVAVNTLDKRLNSMNEFRDTLKDQASKFVIREEMNAKFDGLNNNKKDNTTLFLAIASIVISIVLHFL
jgi:hypothetical protein